MEKAGTLAEAAGIRDFVARARCVSKARRGEGGNGEVRRWLRWIDKIGKYLRSLGRVEGMRVVYGDPRDLNANKMERSVVQELRVKINSWTRISEVPETKVVCVF